MKTYHIQKCDNGWILTTTSGEGLTAATNVSVYLNFPEMVRALTANLEILKD